MNRSAFLLVLPLLAACATTREVPSQLPGVYDLVATDQGSRAGSEGSPSWWITVSSEGTWEAGWEASPTANTQGVYSVEGEEDGCTQLLLRSTDGRLWSSPADKSPEELQFPAELCDGALTILDFPTPNGSALQPRGCALRFLGGWRSVWASPMLG